MDGQLELENSRLRKAVSDLKLLSPARRRACIEQVRAQLHVSERRACAALGQHRRNARSRAVVTWTPAVIQPGLRTPTEASLGNFWKYLSENILNIP
jgi:hypothetical protein